MSADKTSTMQSSNSQTTIMGNPMSLTNQSHNMAVRPLELPLPGRETGCTEFQVMPNMFTMNPNYGDEKLIIFKYDITFLPTLNEKGSMQEEILDQNRDKIEEALGHRSLFCYDNMRLHVLFPEEKRLKNQSYHIKNFSIKTRIVNTDYVVSFRKNQEIHLADIPHQHQSQILHQFLQELFRLNGLARVGRKLCDFSQRPIEIDTYGLGMSKTSPILEFLHAYRISLEATCRFFDGVWISGITVVVDACYHIQQHQSVLELMQAKKNGKKTQKEYERAVVKEIKYQSVLCDYTSSKKVWRIDEIDFEHNVKTYMVIENEEEVSLFDYIKQHFGYECQNVEHAGILINNPNHRVQDAGRERKVAFPPECCKLTGYPKELRSNVTKCRQIAQRCKIDANNRKAQCEHIIDRLSTTAKQLDHFLQIQGQIQPVEARLIDSAPIITLCQDKKKREAKPLRIKDLQQSLKKTTMFSIDQFELKDNEWAVIWDPECKRSLSRAKHVSSKLVKAMKQYPPTKGKLGEPIYVEVKHDRNEEILIQNWKKAIENVMTANPDLKAIVFILPQKSATPDFQKKKVLAKIYATIKHVCCVLNSIVSQCITTVNINTSHAQAGITRQLFTKLGARPWKIRFTNIEGLNLQRPTMMVGLDVNHDAKASQAAIGFVSTWDKDFIQYHSQLKYQDAKQEVIEAYTMKALMTAAIENFHTKNRRYPEQVIVYRDGGAVTQMDQMMNHEIKGIKESFTEMEKKDPTKFTIPALEFICVQKRVNARFLYESADGGMHNVPEGTIVDNKVVSSQNWDWYMIPTDAPTGCTSASTRFIVLVDEMELHKTKEGVLGIEAFTHQLCNLYYNWPGPVRVPSVCKNADKLSQLFGSQIGPAIGEYEYPHWKIKNQLFFL